MKLFKKLIILLIVSIIIYFLSRYIIRIIIYPTLYKEIVIEEAKKSKLNPYLVFAIIKKESGFDKNAISNKGAKGLMQIMDSTAKDVVKSNTSEFSNSNYDIFDPKTNISIGTKYLKLLYDRYDGDTVMVLAAYNAGLGNVDKWRQDTNIVAKKFYLDIEKIPFEETRNYTTLVLKYYREYRHIYDEYNKGGKKL